MHRILTYNFAIGVKLIALSWISFVNLVQKNLDKHKNKNYGVWKENNVYDWAINKTQIAKI